MAILLLKGLILILALLLILVFGSGQVGGVEAFQPSTPNSSYCNITNISNQSASLLSSLNANKAASLAIASPQFSHFSEGFNSQFNSAFITWSYGATCEVKVDAVGAVFDLVQGGFITNQILALENPAITIVNQMELRNITMLAGGTVNSINWAGYEFYGAATERTQHILQDYAEWNVPTISSYPVNWYDCSRACSFSPWVGLSPYQGGYNAVNCPKGCIAQTGTESQSTCTSPRLCQLSYYAWYAFLPSSLVDCLSVSQNDLVAGDVSYSGGTYYLTLTDITSNTGCGTKSGNIPGGTPYYAEMIGERLYLSGSFSTLANFGSSTFSEAQVCPSSTCYGAHYYYQQGWYYIDNMYNSGTKNINVGAVTGSSVPDTSPFTETWLSSQGTCPSSC